MLPPSAAICLIGFAEVGRLGAELAARGCAVRGYEIQPDNTGTGAALPQRRLAAGVHYAATLHECMRGSKLVLCSAPESAATEIVCSAAKLLQQGQIFLDLTAVPAASKRAHASLVEASGAVYVDAARLEPTGSPHLAMALRLVGSRAAELAPALNALGFNTRAASESAGVDQEAAAPDSAQPSAGDVVRQQAFRGELP